MYKRQLQLPEELYIANKYQVSFDENGTIQRIYAFIYGKNEAGAVSYTHLDVYKRQSI